MLGFDFSDNSLDSLSRNWQQLNAEIHDVNYFVNFACVLGAGLLRYEKVNLTLGEKSLPLDTDEFVNLVMTEHKRANNKEQQDEMILRIVAEELKDGTFGRFWVYLLILLSRMKLNVPDLGQYVDPDLPITIARES